MLPVSTHSWSPDRFAPKVKKKIALMFGAAANALYRKHWLKYIVGESEAEKSGKIEIKRCDSMSECCIKSSLTGHSIRMSLKPRTLNECQYWTAPATRRWLARTRFMICEFWIAVPSIVFTHHCANDNEVRCGDALCKTSTTVEYVWIHRHRIIPKIKPFSTQISL